MALTDNLVSYYKLDGDATDAYGSNDGSVNGATLTSSGKINQAYDFDGSDDYIDTGYDFELGESTNPEYTVSQWFKTSGQGWLLNDQDSDAGRDFISGVDVDGSIKPDYFRFAVNGFSYQIFSNNPVNDGEWHHAVCIKDSGTIKLYIDGTLQGTTSGVPNHTKDTKKYVIGYNQQGNNNYFLGKVDEVGIWNRPLTSTEITKLYNEGAGFQYPFEEQTEDSILFRWDGSQWVKVYQSDFQVNL